MPQEPKKRWYDYVVDSLDFLGAFCEFGAWITELLGKALLALLSLFQ